MKFITIVFILLIALIYGCINYYIGLKGYRLIEHFLPFFNSKVYWVLFWFVVFSFIISRIIAKYVPSKLNYLLSIVGYYWMATLEYILISLMIYNFIRLLCKYLYPSLYTILSKNAFTNGAGLILILGIVILLIYGTINARTPVIKSYHLDINKRAGNMKTLKLVFLADLHIGDIIGKSRVVPMINSINELKPDIVLFGGDILDDSTTIFINQNLGKEFRNIKSKFGVYTVLGNHEYYSGNNNIVVDTLTSGNIKVLRDATIKIDDSFYIVGREDLEASRIGITRKTLPDLLHPLDKTLPIILLDHQPPKKKSSIDSSIDLQLSGHTHQGQFFPNQFFTSLLYKLDYGFIKLGASSLIVTSGYGTWGPPIRIGNKPEIVEILINFK